MAQWQREEGWHGAVLAGGAAPKHHSLRTPGATGGARDTGSLLLPRHGVPVAALELGALGAAG